MSGTQKSINLASSERGSSPKDTQALNRMISLTLKNLIIYFVNIVDYKEMSKPIAQAIPG